MVSYLLLTFHEESSEKSLLFSREVAVERASRFMQHLEAEYDLATFDLCSFRSWVARRRQRELHVVGWQMPMNMYGAWLVADAHDFIFFDQNTPRLHQAHIQLHELAHMLLEHQTMDVGKEKGIAYQELMAYFARLLRNPHSHAASYINTMLKRSLDERNTQNELEAEALSVMLQRRVQELQMRDTWQAPLSFSRNPFVINTYQTLGWI